MKLPLSTTCLIIGLFGLIIGVLYNLRNMKKKAALANLIFGYKSAFLEDWFIPAINFIIILTLWLVLPYRSGKIAELSDLYVIGFFWVAGIMGSILLSNGLSSVKKRFDAAIDFKTTEHDKANGTIDTPTPAVKPTKS